MAYYAVVDDVEINIMIQMELGMVK